MEGLKAALDTTKQVITLSTGVIALTLTFLEKIVQPQADAARHVPTALKYSWIGFGLAIVFAIWTLLAITGTMNAVDRKTRGGTLTSAQAHAADLLADGTNVRIPALAMLACFALSIALVIASGFRL